MTTGSDRAQKTQPLNAETFFSHYAPIILGVLVDGTMLRHGLQEIGGGVIQLPRNERQRPRRDFFCVTVSPRPPI